MSRASILAMGRKAAELGMVDECTIERVTATVTNRETGTVEETAEEIYSGPCRVQELGAFSREAVPTPDDPTLMRNRVLQLPVAGSEDIQVKDRVTITACLNDADMVGRVFLVRDQSTKSEATARRIGVEEAT